MKYGRFTKFLHLSIAVTITLQLVLSLLMESPRPHHARTLLQSTGYELHEIVGLTVLALLVMHWLIFLSGNAYKGLGHFFPWFSRQRRQALWDEARKLAKLQLGKPDDQDAVAGAIQGAGLLVGLFLAVSGCLIFLGMANDGTSSETIRWVREFHGFWGPVMWGYLGVHVCATLLHRLQGHREVLEIFRLGASSPVDRDSP